MAELPVLRGLLDALGGVYAAEGRAEADATAAALAKARGTGLMQPRPACVFDGAIRGLLPASQHPAARAILAAQDLIHWGSNPVANRVGPGFTSICAVATLMGPQGPIRNRVYRLGLFYQRPDCYYALHSHNAVETYAILAGTAHWTAGDKIGAKHAGDMIHHPSLLPHAFRTGPEGFLALWRWSGDVRVASYRMLDDPEAVGA